jgi:hypothetical protein
MGLEVAEQPVCRKQTKFVFQNISNILPSSTFFELKLVAQHHFYSQICVCKVLTKLYAQIEKARHFGGQKSRKLASAMGVRSLQTFQQNNVPDGYYEVDILKEIHLYKR